MSAAILTPSFVLTLFRSRRMDTADIASAYGVAEAYIAKLLAEAKDAEHAEKLARAAS